MAHGTLALNGPAGQFCHGQVRGFDALTHVFSRATRCIIVRRREFRTLLAVCIVFFSCLDADGQVTSNGHTLQTQVFSIDDFVRIRLSRLLTPLPPCPVAATAGAHVAATPATVCSTRFGNII